MWLGGGEEAEGRRAGTQPHAKFRLKWRARPVLL